MTETPPIKCNQYADHSNVLNTGVLEDIWGDDFHIFTTSSLSPLRNLKSS